ncbi:MAG: hypothetical protein Q7T38_04145 [Gallionella sp.]|nr:hypothetical protein [Gallionella sp.]
MAISSVNTNPTASSPLNSPLSQIASNAVAPVVDKARSSIDTIPSTIVTLSAQAQKMSQTSTSSTQTANQVDTVAKENVESVPKEANEASGIQFMEGETRGGRISTYA